MFIYVFVPEHVLLFFSFLCFLFLSIYSPLKRFLCISKVPKAVLMGFLSAFVNIIKAELGLALVFFSAYFTLLAAGGGVLPGEVVLSAL